MLVRGRRARWRWNRWLLCIAHIAAAWWKGKQRGDPPGAETRDVRAHARGRKQRRGLRVWAHAPGLLASERRDGPVGGPAPGRRRGRRRAQWTGGGPGLQGGGRPLSRRVAPARGSALAPFGRSPRPRLRVVPGASSLGPNIPARSRDAVCCARSRVGFVVISLSSVAARGVQRRVRRPTPAGRACV